MFMSVVVTAQPKKTEATVAKEQTMSLDVKDTDIRDVIRMISKGYGLNVILDKDITGKVTLHLSDAPIMEGLIALATSNGWEVIKDGSVYRIRKPVARKSSYIDYQRGLLTIDVQNVEVSDFIKEISAKSAQSVVTDTKLTGKVSGKLYRVPFEDGFKAVLQSNNFRVTKRKNIYRVTSGESQGGASKSSSVRPGGYNPSSRSSGGSNFFVECSNDMVTLDVQNGSLSDVISSIADQSEKEVVVYGKVTGEVNAKLNEMPLTEALAVLLGGTQFTFIIREDVILIGNRNTATPSGKSLSTSELFHLRHIKADEVPKILPKNIPATNVKVIKEQNALLISGTSEDIVQTREFLNAVDIPTPQVVIDVLVVEYTRDNDKDFGFSFSGRTGTNEDGSSKNGSNSYSFPNLTINRSGEDAVKVLGSIFPSAKFIDKLTTDFFMQLKLLETQGKAKVMAQPSLTVLNGNKAQINVGQTQYFKVIGGTADAPTENFRPINFGIKLNITPWISKSGQITAEINPEISNSANTNSEGYPNVSNRSVTTTVRIDDGKTLVLGGLIKTEESTAHSQVPILGNIPILGYLFKSTRKITNETNLVIYITPHIVKDNDYVDIGTELERLEAKDRNVMIKTFDKGFNKIEKRRKRRRDKKFHDLEVTANENVNDSLKTDE